MKKNKNLPFREKVAILKKKETATCIAGFALALASVGTIGAAIFGTIPFDKKIDAVLEETGYYEYAEEKKAEYEQQFNDKEISRDVYVAYLNHYGKLSGVQEYFDENGDAESYNKVEGFMKSRQIYTLTMLGVSIAGIMGGLYCLMESKWKGNELQKLIGESNAEGQSVLYNAASAEDDYYDIYPEFEQDEEEKNQND